MTMHPTYLVADDGWSDRLRRICLLLFAMLPLLLLVWRGGADAAASVIGVAFLVVLIARRQWRVMTQPLLLSLLITWLVLNIIVSPLAMHVPSSFSRSVVWLRFVLLFAAATCWLMPSRKDMGFVAMIWAATLAFAALDGTVQLFRGTSLTGQPLFYNRLTGPLDRPNIGIFFARIGLPLLATAVFLLHRKTGVAKMLVPTVLLGLAFILITGERSATALALVSVVCITTVIIITVPGYRLYAVLFAIGTAALLAAIAAVSDRVMTRITAFLSVVENVAASHYGELFSAGLTIWAKHLLTGVGMKNFQAACDLITRSTMKYDCPQHPHNVYIEWLVETGIVGSAGYYAFVLLLIGGLITMMLRHPRLRLVAAFLAGCLIILLFPFTASQSIFSNWPALLFWCGLSMTVAVANLARQEEA